jgi:hypothetical protein
MQNDDTVRGALLTKVGSCILSWSDNRTLRLWDNRWNAAAAF